ncbi:MAG: hypothetical protein LBQ40_06525 [Clostridiales bacterium]|jgi:hypothetical protein|nr:hypothetical protein [Clostridiales bacterium]
MKNNLNEKIKRTLPILIIFSVLFVLGIPGIVVGFVNGWMLLAIPGIIFVVGGFFGLPLGWTAFGTMIESRNLLNAILDGMTDIGDLARSYGKSQRTMKASVVVLLQKRYLTGYKLNDGGTALVVMEKPVEPEAPKKAAALKCAYCGASLPQNAEGEGGVCEYCGTPFL